MLILINTDFESQYEGELAQGSSLTEYNRRFRRDPAPLIAAVLIMTRAQLALRSAGNPLTPRERYYMYQLRGFLNRHVTDALSDPVRATSDQLMIAVSICATLEVRQGSVQGYWTHMNGLRQMINLRGGFAGMGRIDPYLGRFLLWQDMNTSSIAGFPPFFDKANDDATIKAQLRPDPAVHTIICH